MAVVFLPCEVHVHGGSLLRLFPPDASSLLDLSLDLCKKKWRRSFMETLATGSFFVSVSCCSY